LPDKQFAEKQLAHSLLTDFWLAENRTTVG
jgi:hypothetical protein